MSPLRNTALLSLAAAGSIAGSLPVTAAGASPARVRVRVVDPPRVVVTGQSVRLRGSVSGAGRRPLRVALQQRVGGSWEERGRARSAAGGGRFTLVWRAPRAGGVVSVRVQAVSGRRRAARSRSWRVAVSDTRVFSPARVQAAPAAGRAGVLRLSGSATVDVGDFVALDAGPLTPFGLLGRVVHAGASGDGGTSLELRPATLAEAVPEGHIGRADLHAAAAGGTTRDFHSALSCSGGVGASISGRLAVALHPTFDLDWAPWGVTNATAAVTLQGDAELSASVDAAASCSLADTSVATWDAPPLRFFAGPIPVVIVPRTTLYVSATAQVGGAVEAGVHGTVRATAGLRYDGRPHPIGAFEPHLSATPPKTRVTASVGARVTPSVTFLIYGEAGPRFDLATGLQLDAVADADPWWTLAAPLALSAGFSSPALADLEIPQHTVFSRSFPLAQATATPAPPATAPGSGPVDERARVTWESGGSDVDLHVWDEDGNHAWFGNPDAVPGGTLSGDDTDGFGPEVFSAARGERLTYGLCYFDDHGTGAARVTARVTGADGSVHTSTQVLGQKRDHVLLESGGGYVPADGWCSG